MIKDIAIIFSSIILEAMPFLLIGSIIASIIEVFVSSDTIVKLIPKNKILATLSGVCLGFLIPVCDCAVIPVAKKLIKKGVGINVGITFMLASPIINPLVLLSTLYAFYGVNMSVFWYRLFGGILISMVVGIILSLMYKDKEVLLSTAEDDSSCSCCSCHGHDHEHEHKHKGKVKGKTKNISCGNKKRSYKTKKLSKTEIVKNKTISILDHTTREFIGVFKYLIIGALIASTVQVILPQNIWDYFNSNSIVSIIVLMIFAYLISLCSTSDSFLGKSLLSNFGEKSVLAFLLLGPMMDVKNTVVLFGNYNKKFVISFITVVAAAVFIYTLGVMI